ncbi:cytochrome b [Zavarzinia sp. CC-PAN008]|uniref:cytochrome b n=1 Tax=Zavarzinia sp. CC-PAN008 TaxID=3243332 RepID=UPI003F74718F
MTHPTFPLFSRILHWLMAAMILGMLFVGVAMVTSLSDYGRLVALHKPMGIILLVLVAVRLVNRLFNPPPPLPEAMPGWQKALAHGTHLALYALMIALPLVGWGMLSAGGYPVALGGGVVLPRILPHDDALYAQLRMLHTALAYGLFGVFLAHMGAALVHALVFRDGVFGSMATLRRR